MDMAAHILFIHSAPGRKARFGTSFLHAALIEKSIGAAISSSGGTPQEVFEAKPVKNSGGLR